MLMLQALLKIVIAVVILLAIGVGVLGRERLLALIFDPIYGPVTYTPIEFATLERSSRPNQYLMCPPDVCAARVDATSPVYEVSEAALQRAWLALMAQQPRTVQIGLSPDTNQYDFMQRSKWAGFPDTITVKFIALPEGKSTLAIYSRSHYGHSDFGVNRRRIEGWLKRLDQNLAAQSS